MPTYEYECQKCTKRFEYFQSMSEPKKTTCEECGGALDRVIGPAGFILKGGGWYKDLYASAKPGQKSESTATPAKPASESKPASDAASSPKAEGKKAESKKE